MKHNKKGSVRDIVFLFIILFAVAVLFFSSFYTFNVVSDKLLNTSTINDTAGAKSSIQSIKDNSERMDYVILAFFIGLSLAIIITGWFIGGNQLFMMLYFLVLVISVIGSMILSNVWETLSNSSVFRINGVDTVTHFPITNFLITNLPLVVAVIGFLGMISMFAKPYISSGGGEYE